MSCMICTTSQNNKFENIYKTKSAIIINVISFLIHSNLIKALDSGSLMKPNRRNSCTQITDGEVDTMITETENLTSEERHTGKNHKA